VCYLIICCDGARDDGPQRQQRRPAPELLVSKTGGGILQYDVCKGSRRHRPLDRWRDPALTEQYLVGNRRLAAVHAPRVARLFGLQRDGYAVRVRPTWRRCGLTHFGGVNDATVGAPAPRTLRPSWIPLCAAQLHEPK